MNATRIPTGGPDDLEALLRAELGAVADAVGSDGRPAPASALLARGRTARRRRRAALTGAAALATAAVLAVGFGVVRPDVRADSGPAVPLPRPTDVKAWIGSLPVGPIPVVPTTKEGVAAWAGTQTPLPQLAGLSRYGYGFGVTDRGLLLGWLTNQSGDSPPLQLGWLKDGRFTVVETLGLRNAAVSADGTRYAYSGTSATPKGGVLVVRRTADDSVVVRVPMPEGSILRGWFNRRPLVTAEDGSNARILLGATLETATSDLLPRTSDGSTNLPVTALREDLLEYSDPGVTGCPKIQGDSPTVQLAVRRLVGGDMVDGPVMGCFVPDSDPVSPDGTFFVRGGDEFTIRSVATGEPVAGLGPEIPPGATVTVWEPDGKHVQISVTLDPPGGASDGSSDYRRLVRCSVTDGSCVRNV